jgi:arylsulfatase A-like enzyme
MGGITEMATAAPGSTSVRPNTCATIAEILKLNGYATAHIGRCHEVPVWETSPAGPFDRWPSPGNGFEYFHGFLGGETDLTDKAIAWIRQQKALTPDKPFFAYFAPGATHAADPPPRRDPGLGRHG